MDQLISRTRYRSGGFSLIELMITLSILGLGLLTLIMLQIQAVAEGSRAKHRTAASMIVQDEMERIRNMPFSATSLQVMDPVVWTRVPWLTSTGTNGEVPVSVAQAGGNVTELVYTAWYRVLSDPVDVAGNEVRRLDLEVVWQEPKVSNNKPTRTGQPTVAISTILVDNDQ